MRRAMKILFLAIFGAPFRTWICTWPILRVWFNSRLSLQTPHWWREKWTKSPVFQSFLLNHFPSPHQNPTQIPQKDYQSVIPSQNLQTKPIGRFSITAFASLSSIFLPARRVTFPNRHKGTDPSRSAASGRAVPRRFLSIPQGDGCHRGEHVFMTVSTGSTKVLGIFPPSPIPIVFSVSFGHLLGFFCPSPNPLNPLPQLRMSTTRKMRITWIMGSIRTWSTPVFFAAETWASTNEEIEQKVF